MGTRPGRRGPRIVVAIASGLVALAAITSEATAAGKLVFRDCVTAETESGPSPGGTGACLDVGPGLASSGVDTGLDNPESVAVSRDGRSLYAVSREDDALLRYERDPSSRDGRSVYGGVERDDGVARFKRTR